MTITHRMQFGTDTYTQRGSRPVEVTSERYAIYPTHKARANELRDQLDLAKANEQRAQLGWPLLPIPDRERR
ncbi:MAG: hypothetical protein H7315_02290 [Herminiimonas sp.]|nr:hypothetical protein [Herminiimonas sp.]